MGKIKVKNLCHEEYWAPEQECPFCGNLFIHSGSKFCHECGKSFENVEFE